MQRVFRPRIADRRPGDEGLPGAADALALEAGAKRAGRVVIGTVQGDLHDIGKNLVASMLEGGGFEVVDLGVDVPPEKFVEAAKEQEGTIVALSALLTTTMTMMRMVVEALEKAGIREKTKVIIGGAPITQQFADEIGADGYSDNASSAVAVARKLTPRRIVFHRFCVCPPALA